MILTGKCKVDFESWFFKGTHLELSDLELKNTSEADKMDIFYELSESMQYGVYVDFFDSVGIRIELTKCIGGWAIYINGDSDFNLYIKNRKESRTAAIKKVNEIYNK